MKDIVARPFPSALDLDSMLEALRTRARDITWGTRESYYYDIYILGRTPEGCKPRVVAYDGSFDIEVYFIRGETSDADKAAFIQKVDNELLPALAAEAVVEVR